MFWESLRDLCKGLTQSVNAGGGINKLTFGKGTQLLIQPCKCSCPGDGDPVGTFPTSVEDPERGTLSLAWFSAHEKCGAV